MSGVWGRKLELSIFGESHGEAIGITIHGLPAGVELDLAWLQREMDRRAPGRNGLSTPRKESDRFRIVSGYFNNRTTGAPLCALIPNSNQHARDYAELKDIIRPGHADYTAKVKYAGFHDYRGGGHFSGRLTAPLVFAGAVAKQILLKKGIVIGSHIYSIGNIRDEPFDLVNVDDQLLDALSRMDFPVLAAEKGEAMQREILRAKEKLDSVGGVIEAAAINIPPGIGSPFFHSVESTIAQLLFSIPAVKGVEFGKGFELAHIHGSQANDQFYLEDEAIKTYTNNNGGILGGITNGMPVVFRAAFKPTPSIGTPQQTVDTAAGANTVLSVKGRHDPCIVPRAVPVVEAAAALAILDLLLDQASF